MADFKEVLDKCSEEVFTVLYDRHIAAPAAIAPLEAAAPPSAPSKPSFDSAQLGALLCSQ